MWGKGHGKNISMVSTVAGRHGKYRGRGCGRGGGRGNGRTGKDKLILTKTVEGKEIRSSSYSSEEFRTLSKAQRDGVKELQKKLKDQKHNGASGGKNNNISGLTTGDRKSVV